MSQPEPWWYGRCVHRMYPVDHWTLVEEAEQLAVIYCHQLDQIHVCVDIAGVGSVCRTMTLSQWNSMDRGEQLRYVQNECAQLKSIMLH